MLRVICLSMIVPVLLGASKVRSEDMTAQIVVDLSSPGPQFPRTMHGIFFEDINYAADGGLYAELVQNRSFEHRDRMYAWTALGSGEDVQLSIAEEQPLNDRNSHYLRVEARHPSVGAANNGFNGIPIVAGKQYEASVHVRSQEPRDVVVRLLDEHDQSLGEVVLHAEQGEWQRLSGTISASKDAARARLAVLVEQPGTCDFDMISLFPHDTFRGRSNGLRADLAQLLADLKPGFMRFPGGCIVEGRQLDNAYRWKDSVSDLTERRQNWNLWANGESPQYHQTYGLGFFEFFQLCEDIGAEPVPIVNCGMACQARGGRHAPLADLDPWVQDALDLIEFANGPAGSTWGAVRVSMGHPEPFRMKFLGIGNEQWSEEYFLRYEVFYKALRDRYPDIKLISTSGPHPTGDLWSYAWDKFRSGTPTDLVDEHYYRPPQWFLENADRYDRKGPKVFAGEFAAHTTGRRNNLEAALAEAAFMTGLWKNADIVDMACYAPLFARVGNTQWAPDLIWFDNQRSFGSPSYYVQQMYAKHLPELMAPLELTAPEAAPEPFRGRIGVGTWRTQAEFKDIRVVSGDETLYEFNPDQGLQGWEQFGGDWTVVDGALRQTSEAENIRLFTGELDWDNYILTLRARKLSGAEGFLISFAVPHPNSHTWWNLGGWNNTMHGLELRGTAGEQVQGRIETDRWYDIRIEVKGESVSCYLDGEPVQQFPAKSHPALYAASGYNPAAEELVLAVANPSGKPIVTSIQTQGRKLAGGTAQIEVLTAADSAAENSLEEPLHVVAKTNSVEVSASPWSYRFDPHSFTVLKLKTN